MLKGKPLQPDPDSEAEIAERQYEAAVMFLIIGASIAIGFLIEHLIG